MVCLVRKVSKSEGFRLREAIPRWGIASDAAKTSLGRTHKKSTARQRPTDSFNKNYLIKSFSSSKALVADFFRIVALLPEK